MSGFFERHPKINAAVFEASSTWLSFLIDECDKAYKLYRNERQMPPLKRLPSETFFEHCMTGFEGDEAPPARLPEFYGDILCWSSDVYHHDGDDAWRAIETMQKYGLPEDGSGQVPRRQRPAALQGAGAGQHHPRARHRDRAPGLVADRGGECAPRCGRRRLCVAAIAAINDRRNRRR